MSVWAVADAAAATCCLAAIFFETKFLFATSHGNTNLKTPRFCFDLDFVNFGVFLKDIKSFMKKVFFQVHLFEKLLKIKTLFLAGKNFF
jgi:hypothetical protein